VVAAGEREAVSWKHEAERAPARSRMRLDEPSERGKPPGACGTLAVVRLLVLGDRNPEYLTHREIDAALELMPDSVERAWVRSASPQARSLEYGLSERFVPVLERAGVTISASAPDAGVEGIELTDQPFFLATAFQPQVGASEADDLHPLLDAFLDAAAVGGRTPVH
jgi:CTP synthase (UTP-ammonia lyase)